MSAVLSPCGAYRYRLDRTLDRGQGAAVFIMVNPSTADAEQDDPTIRKCIGFSKRLGAAQLIVGNLFAFRATDVNELRRASDPVGPDNDKHLREILRLADWVIVAWGASAKLPEVLRKRWTTVVRLIDKVGKPISCIGTCADGHPKHPLMVGYDAPIRKWNVPWFANRAVEQESPPR